MDRFQFRHVVKRATRLNARELWCPITPNLLFKAIVIGEKSVNRRRTFTWQATIIQFDANGIEYRWKTWNVVTNGTTSSVGFVRDRSPTKPFWSYDEYLKNHESEDDTAYTLGW